MPEVYKAIFKIGQYGSCMGTLAFGSYFDIPSSIFQSWLLGLEIDSWVAKLE